MRSSRLGDSVDWSDDGFGRTIATSLDRNLRKGLADRVERGMLDCRMSHLGLHLHARGVEPKDMYERFGVRRQAFDKWFPRWGKPASDPYAAVKIDANKLQLMELWYRPEFEKSRDHGRELAWGCICGAKYTRAEVLPKFNRRKTSAVRRAGDRRLVKSAPVVTGAELRMSELFELLKLPPPRLGTFNDACKTILHNGPPGPRSDDALNEFTRRMERLCHEWGLALEVTYLFLNNNGSVGMH